MSLGALRELTQVRQLKAYANQDIPAFGVCQVFNTLDDGTLIVGQPVDPCIWTVINGPIDIPAGTFGGVTEDPVVWVLVDPYCTNETPLAVKRGSWKLHKPDPEDPRSIPSWKAVGVKDGDRAICRRWFRPTDNFLVCYKPQIFLQEFSPYLVKIRKWGNAGILYWWSDGPIEIIGFEYDEASPPHGYKFEIINVGDHPFDITHRDPRVPKPFQVRVPGIGLPGFTWRWLPKGGEALVQKSTPTAGKSGDDKATKEDQDGKPAPYIPRDVNPDDVPGEDPWVLGHGAQQIPTMIPTSGVPNIAAPKGALAYNTATGVPYKNKTEGVSDWEPLVPGSSIPLTTKGDLLGYDTGLARVPVGLDGYVLVADSSDAQGVSYKSAANLGAYDALSPQRFFANTISGGSTLDFTNCQFWNNVTASSTQVLPDPTDPLYEFQTIGLTIDPSVVGAVTLSGTMAVPGGVVFSRNYYAGSTAVLRCDGVNWVVNYETAAAAPNADVVGTAGGTYGVTEQTLLNDLVTQFNALQAQLRAVNTLRT